MIAAHWPSTVVFDLDGTLVDSSHDLADALNQLMATRGLAPFSVPEVVDFIGNGIPALITRGLSARGHPPDPDEMNALLTTFRSFYVDCLTKSTKPYAGVLELASNLTSRGIALGVCTNKEEALACGIVDNLGLRDHFTVVVGSKPDRPRKPSPVPLLETIAMLGGTPENSIMVGDSAVDVNCARNAGVAFVGVTFGYSRTPLASLGADIAIDHFSEFGAACEFLRGGAQ